MKFIITVDVEEDDPWSRPERVRTLNSRYVSHFQQLCDHFRFKPTYLCSYEMVLCKTFQTFIKPVLKRDDAEVGAHLHPWRCPPLEELTGQDHKYIPYPHEYPDNLILEKLKNLTQAIRDHIGVEPRSYRAGRWGFTKSHIPMLEALGYRVDSSMTPKVSWQDADGLPGGLGGIDFSLADIYPNYLYHGENGKRRSSILEVPVTILFPFRLFNLWNVRWKFFTNNKNPLLARIIRRVGLAPHWLRQYAYMSLRDLIRVYMRARDINLPCINLMFHSNELMPGGSPYNPDQKSVDALYVKLERLFQFLSQENVQSLTLSGFARLFTEQQ